MVLARAQLAHELGVWRRAARTARLWWRDDDTRGASPALHRLLALADRHAAPLTLAVIPNLGDGEIGDLARARPQLAIIQHGVDHVNRRSGPPAGEFPYDWSVITLVRCLREGWSQLERLPGARKVFAPPWNDVHPNLALALSVGGYAGWSAWGELATRGETPRVDAHVDLLRWRGGARFRGAERFAAGLCAALRKRRRAGLWDAPIGVLTHHQDHDEAAWRHLEAFLAWSQRSSVFTWLPIDAVFPTLPS